MQIYHISDPQNNHNSIYLSVKISSITETYNIYSKKQTECMLIISNTDILINETGQSLIVGQKQGFSPVQ
jgi:hypothetical protein